MQCNSRDAKKTRIRAHDFDRGHPITLERTSSSRCRVNSHAGGIPMLSVVVFVFDAVTPLRTPKE
jgi:hypothetical protein